MTLEYCLLLLYVFLSVLLCFAQVATSMCKSLNISDNDLHSCIFDVAITNDTTFTDQETFKRGKVVFFN